MPTPGSQWWHIILSTYGSWLPGDPRGWRSRKHRVHSSGDYKQRPPAGEHANIHHRAQQQAGPAVVLDPPTRQAVGHVIVDQLIQRDMQVVCLSVAPTHAHLLAELPSELKRTRQIVGYAKRASSHKVRDVVPGRLWARDGSFNRIRDREHQLNTYRYIRRHAGQGAWVWDMQNP